MRARASGASFALGEMSPISSADSSWLSGSSSIDVAFSLPPPQAGLPSRSSGRARQTIRTGASRTQSARCSIRSSSVGSAQCTSSKARTRGDLRASVSTSLRTAQRISSLTAPAVPEPIALSSRAATTSASGVPSSSVTDTATFGGLSHDLPHGPVGDALAVREAAADEHLAPPSTQRPSSWTRRVLPIPASPNTVKSWARRSRVARSRA